MKVTIIYDNTAFRKGLEADWGFSCLVEVQAGQKILFDTGASSHILLSNMKKLGISSKSISDIFISHCHNDHIGGLAGFLEENSKVRIYTPISCAQSFDTERVVRIKNPFKIYENVFSTGQLGEIEQSLVVNTEKGLVIIVGCSHPGVESILVRASTFGIPFALIGGLHSFRAFNLLKDLKLICPTHCTRFGSKIKSLYPEKYIEGGAGRVIEI